MATNKPEVVAWWDGESSITRNVGRPAAHNWHQRIDLIRLSDYEDLQAECEKLRGLLAEIGRGCSRRDMPSEQTIASWAEAIDTATQRDKP